MKSVKYGSIVIILTVCIFASQGFAEVKTNLLQNAKIDFSLVTEGKENPWRETIDLAERGKYQVRVRYTFRTQKKSSWVSLSLQKKASLTKWYLNGNLIPLPLKGMRYKIIPGIDVNLLKNSENILQTILSVRALSKNFKISYDMKNIRAKLYALTEDDLAFQTGPILGFAGTNFFTVTCRTNIPSRVQLVINGKVAKTSAKSLMHKFIADNLKPNTKYQYKLIAQIPGKKTQVSTKTYTVSTFPSDGKIRFVVMGDSRTFPDKWAAVANAVLKDKPMFIIFVGDMVNSGRNDWEWDEHYWENAKELLATIPTFAVIGNHEANDPAFHHIFFTPNDKIHWSRDISSLTLIATDTNSKDWAPNQKRNQWLKSILHKTDKPFVMLANHYGAWTSGTHGKLRENGEPRERGVRNAQKYVMPLLAQYHVQVFVAGHDHIYERSEPDNGVTMIVSGGAGAPLYAKVKNAHLQNPYSKVFESKLHYCIFTVDKTEMKMTAKTPEGKIIDQKTWKPRKEKQR